MRTFWCIAFAVLLVAGLWGCAEDGTLIGGGVCEADCCGNGDLDPGEECDDGNGLDGDGCSSACTIEFGEPTLTWIQDNIFSPVCAACHIPGGTGPMPLHNETASYDSLVIFPFSFYCTPLPRVTPGDPEASCIIRKLEGSQTVIGTRMPPPPLPALSQDQIDVIRQWILDGALP